MRSWRWSPDPKDWCPYKELLQSSLSLSLSSQVRTQWKDSHLQSRKRALTRNEIGWHIDLGLPKICEDPELWKINFCCLSLWHFVMAASYNWANWLNLNRGLVGFYKCSTNQHSFKHKLASISISNINTHSRFSSDVETDDATDMPPRRCESVMMPWLQGSIQDLWGKPWSESCHWFSMRL